MKKRVLSVLLTVLFILPLAAGCTPQNIDTTDTEEAPQSTDTETDAETEPEEEKRSADLTVTSLSVADKISLTYELKTEPGDLYGKIRVKATSESGAEKEGVFDINGTAELESPSAGGVINIPASEDDKKSEFAEYENMALKKPVTSATVEGAYLDKYAVDGSFTSRWGSLSTGESWLCVDLQEVRHIKGMLLYLEAAWVPYRVEYSNDGDSFTTLASFGSGEVFVKLKDLDFDARYVRFIREGENWFSIYEVEIYG